MKGNFVFKKLIAGKLAFAFTLTFCLALAGQLFAFVQKRSYAILYVPWDEYSIRYSFWGESYSLPVWACWYVPSTLLHLCIGPGGTQDFMFDSVTLSHVPSPPPPAQFVLTKSAIDYFLESFSDPSAYKPQISLSSNAIKDVLPELYDRVEGSKRVIFRLRGKVRDVLLPTDFLVFDAGKVRFKNPQSVTFWVNQVTDCYEGNWSDFVFAKFSFSVSAFTEDGNLAISFGSVTAYVPIRFEYAQWYGPYGIEGRYIWSGSIHSRIPLCKTSVLIELDDTAEKIGYADFERIRGRVKYLLSKLVWRMLEPMDWVPVTQVQFKDFVLAVSDVYPAYIFAGLVSEPAIVFSLADRDEVFGIHTFVGPSQVYIEGGPPAVLGKGKVNFTVSVTHPMSLTTFVAFKFDDGPWSGWRRVERRSGRFFAKFEVEKPIYGRKRVMFLSRDVLGNMTYHLMTLEFFVDTVAPDIKVDWDTASPSPRLKITAHDDTTLSPKVEVVLMRVEGTHLRDIAKISRRGGEVEFVFDNLDEGKYAFLVFAEDDVGNRTPAFSGSFFVDRTPPVFKILDLMPEYVPFSDIRLFFRAYDNSGVLPSVFWNVVPLGQRCSPERRPQKNNFIEIYGLEDGNTYLFCAFAVDVGGNATEQINWIFTVDTQKPEIEFIDFPSRITIFLPVKISFRVSDNITPPDKIKLEWDLTGRRNFGKMTRDGDIFTIVFDELEDGVWVFSVWAYDLAGNSSEVSPRSFIVDRSLARVSGGGGGEGGGGGCSAVSPTFPLTLLVFLFLLSRKFGRGEGGGGGLVG